MIHPLNVYQKTAQAGKLDAKSKQSFIVGMFLILNVISFFIIYGIMQNFFGLGFGWAILVQLILLILISIPLFRFVIFDENEKIREHRSSDSDSFSRFYKIGKDSQSELDLGRNQKVNIFESLNGSTVLCIRLRYGGNNMTKAKLTSLVMQEFFRLLAYHSLEYDTVVMSEEFADTRESELLINRVNGGGDLDLRYTMLTVTTNLLEQSKHLSCVDVNYIVVRARTESQKADLEIALKEILNLLITNPCAIRSFEFLNHKQFLDFCRVYYGLETIDLTMLKAMKPDPELIDAYMKYVKVCSIETTAGVTFENENSLNKYMNTNAKEVNHQ